MPQNHRPAWRRTRAASCRNRGRHHPGIGGRLRRNLHAGQLGNVSKACRIVGYSRQQFYEIRRNFQTYGADGLLDRIAGPLNLHPNRVGEDVEKAILDHCLAHPRHGALRVAGELALSGI